MQIFDFFKNRKKIIVPQYFNEISHNIETETKSFTHTYEFHQTGTMTEFIELENNKNASWVWYLLNGNELKICDIFALGDDTQYHHGTELLVELLRQLNQPIIKIYGELSFVDAYNKSWKTSIPFYQDLPTYINESLGLQYKFYLFDDNSFTNDVTSILYPIEMRDTNIEIYRLSHLYDQNHNVHNRSGSFFYLLQ